MNTNRFRHPSLQRCLTVWRNLSNSRRFECPYAKEAIAWVVTYIPTWSFVMELWPKCRDLTLAPDQQRNRDADLTRSHIWSSPLSVVNAPLHLVLQVWEKYELRAYKQAPPKWLGSVFRTRQTGIEGNVSKKICSRVYSRWSNSNWIIMKRKWRFWTDVII